MQQEGNDIAATLVHAVILLGILALAGLMLLAFMSGSIFAMRSAVFIAGMAYGAQCLMTYAMYAPGKVGDVAYVGGVTLWGLVVGAFLVAVTSIG